MDRRQKQQVVETLERDLAETACVVVTHQSGLNVSEATQLRRQVRSAGANFRVIGNDKIQLDLGYRGEFGKSVTSQTANVKLKVAF